MKKHNESKIQKALNYLQEKHNAEWALSYGEPGYQDPDRGVILCNWNNTPSGLGEWLESCGYSLEWSDEWLIDYDNGKAYRTSPDCYSWQPQTMHTNDGELLTPDDGASAWVDELAMSDHGHPCKAVPSWITESDLIENGFELFAGDFETGFHTGQTDAPEPVARRAFDAGASRVIFRITGSGQFDINWECWVEKESQEVDT